LGAHEKKKSHLECIKANQISDVHFPKNAKPPIPTTSKSHKANCQPCPPRGERGWKGLARGSGVAMGGDSAALTGWCEKQKHLSKYLTASGDAPQPPICFWTVGKESAAGCWPGER